MLGVYEIHKHLKVNGNAVKIFQYKDQEYESWLEIYFTQSLKLDLHSTDICICSLIELCFMNKVFLCKKYLA